MGNINNNGVARVGTRTRILQNGGIELKDGTVIQAGTADPTQTAQNMPAGSIYYDTTKKRAFQKMDAGSTTNFRLLRADEFTKEPTGFVDNSLITVTYNGTTDRSVVVTSSSGTVEFLLRGRLFAYASPWTVPTVLGGATPITHTNSNGRYFLKIDPDTLTVSFGTTVWAFTDLMICFAFKNATAQFGLRECHQLMPNQSHESDHYTKGTYIRVPAAMTTGTAFTAATSSVATANSNCPGIDAHTIYDEDIATPIAAWPEASYNVSDVYQSGAYTTAYRNGGSGVITFNTAAQLPYIVAGGGVGVLQYNPISSGSGALANVTEDGFVNVLAISLPATADAESQKFRTIWFLGQQQFTTLAAAQLQAPGSWEYGELLNSITEAVAVQMYSYQYNAAGGGANGATPATVPGRAFLAALPVVFTGARNSQIGTVGVSPSDHQTLSNRSATASHPASAIDVSSVTWTAGGVLSATQTTVEQALDKLSSTFAASGAVGLVSATTQTFTGLKTFETVGTYVFGANVGATSDILVLAAGTGSAYFSVQRGGVTRATFGADAGNAIITGVPANGFSLNSQAGLYFSSSSDALHGKCESGAWTFPVATTHTFGPGGTTDGGDTFVSINCSTQTASEGAFRIAKNGTNLWQILYSATTGYRYFHSTDEPVNIYTGAGNTLSASISYQGAWTFPVCTTHIFGDNAGAANTNLSLRTGASNSPFITFYRNGGKFEFGCNSAGPGGTDGLYWYDLVNSKYTGGIAPGGAWTLGDVNTRSASISHKIVNNTAQFSAVQLTGVTQNTWYTIGTVQNTTYGIAEIYVFAGKSGVRHGARSFILHWGVGTGTGTNPVTLSSTYAGGDPGIEVQISGSNLQTRITTTNNDYINAHFTEHTY